MKPLTFVRQKELNHTGGIISMKKLVTLLTVATLALLSFGCGDSGNTTNTANTANTVVVTNTANTANRANTNNSNANRGAYNANISQEDYEKDKETFGQKAKDLGDKVGTSLTDGWLWVKTRGALMGVDDLEESSINVDVNDGVITLRGTVPTADQVKKADAAAKGISGSKSVQNQLKVGASGGATGNSNAKK
jgi:hypothetical protein